MCASKHRLNRLTVIVDYNKMQCFGNTCDVMNLEPFVDKWLSFGFVAREVDGHDVQALRKTLFEVPLDDSKPGIIICHTIKGKGIAFLEGNASWHHKGKISDEEMHTLLMGLETSNEKNLSERNI